MSTFRQKFIKFSIFDALSLSAQLDYKLDSKIAVDLIEYSKGLHLANKGVPRHTPSVFLKKVGYTQSCLNRQ